MPITLTLLAPGRCRRCGGNLFLEHGEVVCLQCGFRRELQGETLKLVAAHKPT